MNTPTNINSLSEHINDQRLAEILPTVPDGVRVAFYGHIRVAPTGYGQWRVTVELDINGSTERYSFKTNDEDLKLVLEGADYRDFGRAYPEAVDLALSTAIEENYAEVYGDLKLAVLDEAED